MKTDYYIFIDGSCFNSPGVNTAGWVAIMTASPNPTKEDILLQKSGTLQNATNNQAEWAAMLGAMQLILESEADALFTICSDSELIVNQATEVYNVRDKDLRRFYAAFKQLKIRVEEDTKALYSINWISRKYNKLADKLSKENNPYFNKKNERIT